MLKKSLCLLTTLVLVTALPACGEKQNGPPSTRTSSASIDTLAERIEFLEKYLTFRRQYEELEFDIAFMNNSGWLPGPSDWDIKLVAKVPASELSLWTKDSTKTTDAKEWPTKFAQEIDVSGIDIWYESNGKVVGVDEDNSIVAYRASTFGL